MHMHGDNPLSKRYLSLYQGFSRLFSSS